MPCIVFNTQETWIHESPRHVRNRCQPNLEIAHGEALQNSPDRPRWDPRCFVSTKLNRCWRHVAWNLDHGGVSKGFGCMDTRHITIFMRHSPNRLVEENIEHSMHPQCTFKHKNTPPSLVFTLQRIFQQWSLKPNSIRV